MGNSMILTIGTLVLFGAFTIGSFALMSNNAEIVSDNEYCLTAISLAQSVMDEAKSKSFDEKSVTRSFSSPDSLTLPNLIGNDGGAESFKLPDAVNGNAAYSSLSKFNDVDDYNGYWRITNTPRASGYDIRVSVKYASPTDPDSVKSFRTFCKKMDVSVSHKFLARPITLSYAFMY
jgi:hypothetical protein